MFHALRPLAALALLLAATTAAHAGVLPAQPFTETFNTDDANWQTGLFQPPTYVPSGSFDGSGYISAQRDLADAGGFGVTVFRAELNLNSSDGNFAGNYIAGGINQISFQIRHDAPVPVGGLVRFATPANFPAVFWFFEPVQPNQWTEVIIDLDPNAPNFQASGAPAQWPQLYLNSFSNVGNLQFAFERPEGFVSEGPTTFDIDQVRIIPTPAGLLAFTPLALIATRRRRN